MKIHQAALALLLAAPFAAHAQNKAIDFDPKMPFSNAVVAGNTLYVAGQQGSGKDGKLTTLSIEDQTANTIVAIQLAR